MRKWIHQEGLKALACICMLLDHVGAVLVPTVELRIIGRLAFPIYCYLLVEGAAHTRSPAKYALRLTAGAALSELPFDLLFYGGLNWKHQSVMVTLVLGLGMVLWFRKWGQILLPLCLFCLLAELLGCDYGGWGIALVALFALGRNLPVQLLGMAVIFWCMNSFRVALGPVRIPIQMFGLAALVPIGLYSGRKTNASRMIQWGFYLFYPVHLAVLWLIKGSY